MVKIEFSRNLGLISEAEQDRLHNSSVAIAGAGGDGGMLAVQLARLGVGKFRLADPEVFDSENLNRQACSTQNTIGKNKAASVGHYLNEINPDAEVEVYTEGVTRDNVEDFVNGSDILIDETEFSLHAIGTMLARSARRAQIPNLMAMNIGFGATVTTFHPRGKTFENMLGLSENQSLEEIEASEVSLRKWLAYIPPYADIDVFRAVAEGEKPAPSVAPGVNLASAIGASQALLSLTRDINKRPNPVYSPRVIMMDAMTGESKLIKHPAIASRVYLVRMVMNNTLGRAPKADY